MTCAVEEFECLKELYGFLTMALDDGDVNEGDTINARELARPCVRGE